MGGRDVLGGKDISGGGEILGGGFILSCRKILGGEDIFGGGVILHFLCLISRFGFWSYFRWRSDFELQEHFGWQSRFG